MSELLNYNWHAQGWKASEVCWYEAVRALFTFSDLSKHIWIKIGCIIIWWAVNWTSGFAVALQSWCKLHHAGVAATRRVRPDWQLPSLSQGGTAATHWYVCLQGIRVSNGDDCSRTPVQLFHWRGRMTCVKVLLTSCSNVNVEFVDDDDKYVDDLEIECLESFLWWSTTDAEIKDPPTWWEPRAMKVPSF